MSDFAIEKLEERKLKFEEKFNAVHLRYHGAAGDCDQEPAEGDINAEEQPYQKYWKKPQIKKKSDLELDAEALDKLVRDHADMYAWHRGGLELELGEDTEDEDYQSSWANMFIYHAAQQNQEYYPNA